MHKKSKSPITIEIIIVLIIAVCMIFLNFFTTSKLSELERSSNEAMFIRNDLPFMNSDEFTEEILEYKPESCKMIEMYDDQFNLLLMIQFDQDKAVDNHDITEYPDLISTLECNTEGQVNIAKMKDGYEENVYFQWINNSNGDRRLIMVYSTKLIVNNLWIFSFVCYFVILLVFILLIRLKLDQCRSNIKQYDTTSTIVRDRVNS